MIYWEFVDWGAVATCAIWFGVLLMTLKSAGVGEAHYRSMQELVEEQNKVLENRAQHIAELHAGIQKLHSLIQAGVYVGCMIEGGRPIVTKAPEGMTVEEAQAEIDKIFLTVKSTEGEATR